VYAFPAQQFFTNLRSLNTARAQLTGSPRNDQLQRVQKMIEQFNGMSKTYTISARVLSGESPTSSVFQLPGDKLICSKRVLKISNKTIDLVGEFDSSSYVKTDNPEYAKAREFFKFMDNIFSVSPDGKYAASGTHIYDVNTRKILKKLPFPSIRHAFSKDGKNLYILSMKGHFIYPLIDWQTSAPDPEKMDK
jgi:hypothetical protein